LSLSKNKPLHEQEVKRFFDSIATDYASRYRGENAYYRYFFNERLRHATAGFHFENKTVLDVGAGSGALYDYLRNTASAFRYFATDISPEMLAASNIPPHLRFCGNLREAPFPDSPFDFIFLLGVTSYLPPGSVPDDLHFLQTHLAPGGRLVVSFTHRCSLDFQVRRIIRFDKLLKFIKPARSRIIGQSFDVQAFSLQEAKNMSFPGAEIEKVVWLNQTLSPFNHLFPKAAVWVAAWLRRLFGGSRLLPFLSSDFLVVFEKPA
jgi:SAM-dependent methyltransferase